MKVLLCFFLLITILSSLATATIINIPDDYGTIQEGIYASSDGDTVLVQPGTYFENINFNGHSIVLGSLFLTTEDTSYISTTIIDGDSLGHVVRFYNDEDSTTTITGFTIQNGWAGSGGGIIGVGSSPQICYNIIRWNSAVEKGGGIYLNSPTDIATPRINNNIIIENSAVDFGGGIYNQNSITLVNDNKIMRNTAHDGAGIYYKAYVSNPVILNNYIAENEAVSGGGVLCRSSTILVDNLITNNIADEGGGVRIGRRSSAIVSNNTIISNCARIAGAGIYCYYTNWAVIENNQIKDNYSDAMGGGIFCRNGAKANILYNSIDNNSAIFGAGICCASSPVIKGNSIFNNTAVLRGAGIYCYENANPVITHNVIYNNNGNGICCFSSDPKIFNNVIASNYSTFAGGIYCWLSNPQIMNSILWANTDSGGTEILLEEGSDPYITFCDIQGGWEGEGNLNVDPLFRDPVNGDYHLMATYCDDPFDSPLIDAGNPSYSDTLLDCDWGLGTEVCDMGAFSGEGIPTDVQEIDTPSLPNQTSLSQNYPNPFNPVTTIEYTLPYQSDVRLEIYNLLGQRVETLVDNKQKPGNHSINWDASGFSSGIYFYKLSTENKTITKRMTLLK